jgi:hypothetical protein
MDEERILSPSNSRRVETFLVVAAVRLRLWHERLRPIAEQYDG